MNKVRYIEKKYLCKYDLSEEFFKNINLEALDITPLRKLYILDTTSGKKILKRVEYEEERINFICLALDYINRNFTNTIKFDVLCNNKKCVEWNGDKYILMDVIKGREVTFTNQIEVELCAQTIAKYHESGKGIKDYIEIIMGKKIILKDIPNMYKETLKNIDEIYSRVKGFTFLDDFDRKFIEKYNEIKEDINKAIEWSENKFEYNNLINKQDLITLCHNDLAHHNFIIDEGIVSLLDFDYCSIGLRVIDLGDFIIKSIKNAAYDIEKGINALKAYNEVTQLDKEELNLLYSILIFPKEICTIIKDYYYKRKDWEEEAFISKFDFKLLNEDFRKEFCEEYKKIFL
ncbi:MAG: CotS family spore coat protein [Clostridium sp.]